MMLYAIRGFVQMRNVSPQLPLADFRVDIYAATNEND